MDLGIHVVATWEVSERVRFACSTIFGLVLWVTEHLQEDQDPEPSFRTLYCSHDQHCSLHLLVVLMLWLMGVATFRARSSSVAFTCAFPMVTFETLLKGRMSSDYIKPSAEITIPSTSLSLFTGAVHLCVIG